ncbi:flavin-containing monooxygenase [Paraflavitalea pollutisoli]|uniref:flavin-containing monooxygenase n=1 Tax=Paraflavitalea pollutisoli TaxID=3034143 RepID=UPI0023EDFF71|nr:NAD(P)-binding domain-containing protein [Paraflavitalea sp. H1-2-19X]
MKHVGIIGAGISGLTTAKTFLEKGYRVTVLEKTADLGGVWEKSRSYLGVATQTTRDEYAFSDFPMPAAYPLWPSGEQVQAYLRSYAVSKHIWPHIWFNTRVDRLLFDQSKWEAHITDLRQQTTHQLSFDFVVICTGTFHQPHVPAFAGIDSFVAAGGQLLHSSEVKSDRLLHNKAVTVVGFAKSATDIATLSAGLASSTTLLYRTAQWKVPRYFGNKINMRFLLFSRLSEAFFNAPRKSFAQRLLHSVGRPLVWAQWRGLEALLKWQFKLKACGMLPTHRIEDQISCSLGVAPEGFYELVHQQKIKAHQSEIARIDGKQLVLANGQTIHTDVLVCGTGFTQELPFLDEKYRHLIVGDDKRYHLFRNIVHPLVPQLGFVGFNSSLFTTLTSEVAASWLLRYMEQSLHLPDAAAMQEDMAFMDAWRTQSRPIAAEFGGTCIAPFNYMHLDQLMTDMGLPVKTGRGLKAYLKPINPADYHQLLRGSRQQPAMLKKVKPAYQYY